MKKYSRISALCSVAPMAIFAVVASPAWAGTFEDDALLGVFGDGIVYVDVKEGVEEPGLMAITTSPNIDYPNTRNPSGIENCLMASNPLNNCRSEQGSGKRIKSWMTGNGPLDLSLGTQASSGITEYFYYGKTMNFTGARLTGVKLQFGTGTGSGFVPMDTSDPATAALFDEDYDNKFNLPDGLFGNGGQESIGIGFFDDEKALINVDRTDAATLEASGIANPEYQSYFGTGILDNSMLPKAFFWDASDTVLADDEDEFIPIAWYNRAEGKWLYGNLGVPSSPELDQRLSLLAGELGVTVADLGYGLGDEIPDEVLAEIKADGLFEIAPLEDLRNMNLNFITDLGDVAGGQVTLRIRPTFSDLVMAAKTERQFKMAAILDAAANVPFLYTGDTALFQAAVDDIMALSPSGVVNALDSLNYSFAQAFSSLNFEYSRNQIALIRDTRPKTGAAAAMMSSQGNAKTGELDDGLHWIFGLDGVRSSYDATENSVGYDIDFTALSVGLEKYINDGLSFGVLVGGSFGGADADSGRGSIDADGLSIAGFARARFGDAGLVQAVLGYQDMSYESERKIAGRTAKADTDGSQTYAALDGEYMFRNGAFRFGPAASLEYYSLSVDSFEESGAGVLNLDVDDMSADITLGSIGVRGDYVVPGASGNNLVTAGIAYTFADGDDMTVESGFVGLPAIGYVVDGMDEEWVDVNLGFEANLSQSGTSSTYLAGGYRGAFGDSYESHGFHLSMNMQF